LFSLSIYRNQLLVSFFSLSLLLLPNK